MHTCLAIHITCLLNVEQRISSVDESETESTRDLAFAFSSVNSYSIRALRTFAVVEHHGSDVFKIISCEQQEWSTNITALKHSFSLMGIFPFSGIEIHTTNPFHPFKKISALPLSRLPKINTIIFRPRSPAFHLLSALLVGVPQCHARLRPSSTNETRVGFRSLGRACRVCGEKCG